MRTGRRPLPGAGPPASIRPDSERVLVPMVHSQRAKEVLSVGDALASSDPWSSGLILGLVETSLPDQEFAAAERVRAMLRWLAMADYQNPHGKGMGVEVKLTSDPVDTVRSVAAESGITSLVLAGPPEKGGRRHRLTAIYESLAVNPPANLVVVHPDPRQGERELAPRSILVPFRGGPHAQLTSRVVNALAKYCDARVVALRIYPPTDHPDHRRRAREEFLTFVDTLEGPGVESSEKDGDAAEVILDEIARHDLAVLGAHIEPGVTATASHGWLRHLTEKAPRALIFTHARGAVSWALPKEQ